MHSHDSDGTIINGGGSGDGAGLKFNNSFELAFLKSADMCDPTCAVCIKLTRRRLDASPVVLSNELTGELKAVPAYAVQDYLSKWSPYREVPSHKAKKLLGENSFCIKVL